MDTRLKQALDFANYRHTIQKKREIIKTWISNSLHYSENGGTFFIDSNLIVFVGRLKDEEEQEFIIFDMYENPITIQVDEFYKNIKRRYREVANHASVQYKKLQKQRDISSVLDWHSDK